MEEKRTKMMLKLVVPEEESQSVQVRRAIWDAISEGNEKRPVEMQGNATAFISGF